MLKLKPIHLVLILALSLLLIQVNKPFYGYHDWNGVTYGQIAQNYTRYGLLSTKLGQVENLSLSNPDNFTYDTHYPPLFTLLLSIPVALFGPQAWAIRLLPIFISLGSLYLIYLLGKTIKNENTGLIAAILSLFTPVFIYFGKNPVHEPLSLFFILLVTYLFIRPNRSFKPLFITILISLFSSWPVYYIVPLVAIIGFVQTKQKRYLSLLLLPFLVVLLHLAHVKLLTGSFFGGGLGSIIKYRLSIQTPIEKYSFTLSEFISRFSLFSRNMFTLPLVITSAVGFVSLPKYRLPLILLLTGLVHPLIFSNAGYIHDYLQLPALGFVGLSSALVLSKITSKKLLLPVGIILAFLSLSTKLPFTKAMVNSTMSKPEYDLAISVIKPLKVGQNLTLTPEKAVLLKGVVAPYYLQKEIEYTFAKSTSYLVTVKSDKIVITPNEKN